MKHYLCYYIYLYLRFHYVEKLSLNILKEKNGFTDMSLCTKTLSFEDNFKSINEFYLKSHIFYQTIFAAVGIELLSGHHQDYTLYVRTQQ